MRSAMSRRVKPSGKTIRNGFGGGGGGGGGGGAALRRERTRAATPSTIRADDEERHDERDRAPQHDPPGRYRRALLDHSR